MAEASTNRCKVSDIKVSDGRDASQGIVRVPVDILCSARMHIVTDIGVIFSHPPKREPSAVRVEFNGNVSDASPCLKLSRVTDTLYSCDESFSDKHIRRIRRACWKWTVLYYDVTKFEEAALFENKSHKSHDVHTQFEGDVHATQFENKAVIILNGWYLHNASTSPRLKSIGVSYDMLSLQHLLSDTSSHVPWEAKSGLVPPDTTVVLLSPTTSSLCITYRHGKDTSACRFKLDANDIIMLKHWGTSRLVLYSTPPDIAAIEPVTCIVD